MQKNKIEKKRVKSNRARMSNLQPKTWDHDTNKKQKKKIKPNTQQIQCKKNEIKKIN
jgi:hypothetical protein